MEEDTINEIIDDILGRLKLSNWTKVPHHLVRKEYGLKTNDEVFDICDYIVKNGYVESCYPTHVQLKLTTKGLEIQDLGGWLKYLKQKNQPTPKPIIKPDKKSFVKKFLYNPYTIFLFSLVVEEITLGKIWKTICDLINTKN